MKKHLLFQFLVFAFATQLYSQDHVADSTVAEYQKFKVEAEIGNLSRSINDGFIELKVRGGQPPYTYKWSNQSTPMKSNTAEGLVEGVDYQVVITDAAQNSVTRSFRVKAKSITEHFNGIFTPIVNSMGQVLFWDPFAAIGIYDPVIYAEEKLEAAPGWEATTDKVFTLKEWTKPEGTHVNKGDQIAVIGIEPGEDMPMYATTNGILEHRVEEDTVFFNPENTEHLIEEGSQYVAAVQFDEPIPLKHPNGDLQRSGIPFIVVWLILGALFFTLRMGFINFRGFKHAIDLAKGKFDDPTAPGEVTHFQALATAVSGTVGLGNIAGVAVAISLGGAGATFWMIIAGLLGMSSKFVECTLGVKYRSIGEDGRVFGGPMSYLRYGLEKRGLYGFGKVLAMVFAILAVLASFGGGNMFQANQSYEILASQFPTLEGNGFWFGIIIMVLVSFVIVGGIKSIAKVTDKLVPMMAIVYFVGAITVILVNVENIGPAFSAIVGGAFEASALKGGVVGVLIVGFQRAAFSNEAGVGSAAIAHSVAKTKNPPSEGFVSLLEPFLDTVVICTLTALVLIFTGMHEVPGVGGVELTSQAFGSVVSWFPYVLAVAVFLFAFSTMISWSYYGMRAWTYLFGKSKRTELIYKLFFLFFVVVGASISLGAVLDFSDMMILAMSFPNIIGLYLMSGEVRKDLNDYLRRLKKGELFRNPDKTK